LDDIDLPALFWDSIPDGAEEHPDYVALQALAEESTPEERAENFKVLHRRDWGLMYSTGSYAHTYRRPHWQSTSVV
jgi:hypothetical protein